jgi:hypothetical protein
MTISIPDSPSEVAIALRASQRVVSASATTPALREQATGFPPSHQKVLFQDKSRQFIFAVSKTQMPFLGFDPERKYMKRGRSTSDHPPSGFI